MFDWKILKKGLKIALLLFIALFAVRLAYGFYTTPNEVRKVSAADYARESQDVFSSAKRNYASDKYVYKNAQEPAAQPGGVQGQMTLDQKYEKTAKIISGTNDFLKDEESLRNRVKENEAIIQYEQNSGNEGARVLNLMIGVQPSRFDQFSDALKKIGKIKSVTVTKTDKTNEFLDLKAQRDSLENTKRELAQLKNMKGNVDEFINLQYRILDIDKQLQDLGVKLGDYDEVNEFCTVRFTLYEDKELFVYPPSVVTRLMVAFKWTVKYYLAGAAILTFCALFILILMVLAVIFKKFIQWGLEPRPGNKEKPENSR